MGPGKRRQLDKSEPLGRMMEDLERIKAQLRATAEHAFRVVKQQFGFTKVRYKGINKNHAKLNTLFMLSNLWMVRKTPQACGGWCA
jgi:transposase, IS5 family